MENKKIILKAWVQWLTRNGGRPSDQRVKDYLEGRAIFTNGAYKNYASVIGSFCNYWIGPGKETELIKAEVLIGMELA